MILNYELWIMNYEIILTGTITTWTRLWIKVEWLIVNAHVDVIVHVNQTTHKFQKSYRLTFINFLTPLTYQLKNSSTSYLKIQQCDDCDSKKCNFFIFVLHLTPGGKCNIFIVKLQFLSSHCHKNHLKSMLFSWHKYHDNTLKVWHLRVKSMLFLN